jgi:hypothetical protein
MTALAEKTIANVQAFDLAGLVDRNWAPPEHVISPWLETGESALLWAPTGVGKTMLSLSLALMVAGGGSFAGWSCDRPRRVLIVDGEMRGRDIAGRLKDLQKTIEGLDVEAARKNLQVIPRTMQDVDVPFFDISDEETQNAIIKRVVEDRIDLLILDNLTTLADGMGDENAVDQMRPVLKLLMNLKRTNVAVLLVHHSNKNGNTYRGSTSIAATFEIIMGLQKPDGAMVDQADFLLKFDKHRARGSGKLAVRRFTLGDAQWDVTEDQDELLHKLIAAIQSCEFDTQEAAGASVGIQDKTKVSKMLKRADALELLLTAEKRRCLAAAKADPFEDTEDDTL